MDAQEAWLTLMRAPGAGPVRLARLLARHGDAAAALAAGDRAWRDAGLPADTREWLATPDAEAIAADRRWLAEADRHLIPFDDASYPARLRTLADPPPALFAIGDTDLIARPGIAIVGSRNPSPDGAEQARAFAAALAQAGLVVVSGLARGIDAAAHEGALAVDGMTAGVAGTGLDRVYPAANRELARTIGARGVLVSEFPPGTPAISGNFPRRNRVISGLTLGTLVVEAARASGSLITARLAMEQGREVFAVPGSVHNPLARGCHRLIRDGAKLVESADDVIEEIGAQVEIPRTTRPDASRETSEAGAEPPDADYRHLLGCLGDAPVDVDTLVERSGLTADAVSSMLLILELQGLVTTTPGGAYTRVA